MNTLRIVLLGKTGTGKSSCGNTILNENSFLTELSPSSVTRNCKSKKKSILEKEIMLVDTPGFFDTDLSEEELKSEILRCITECAPGPHAFVIVLKAETYTKHEKEVVRKIIDSFGEKALKHTVVLFTHGDQLSEDQKIEDFVGKNAELQELVDKCGGRVHVFDNKYWNQQQEGYRSNRVQVENLLNTMEEMVRENGGQYYSNEMLQMVNTAIEAECESLKRKGNKESLDMAKQTVFDRLFVRLAGVGTGVLLGAFLGAAGGLAIVSVIMKELLSSGVFGGFTVPPNVTLGVLGTSAVAGAVAGGVKGYKAAEGAETLTEAVRRTAGETYETVTNVVQNVRTFSKNQNY